MSDPLPVAEQRIVGRVTGGHVADLTATQVKTVLSYQDDLTSYLGQQTLSGFDGTTGTGSAAAPTFFDPASTHWYDHGWFAIAYHDTDNVDWFLGSHDADSDPTLPFVNFFAAPGTAGFGIYINNGGPRVQFLMSTTEAEIDVRGVSGQTSALLDIKSNDVTHLLQVTGDKKIGFFGATPVTQRTGVAVTAAGIHAALVSLGLITA